jgi:serine/threonine protein kinase
MHKKGIFHRDIKPENILIDSSTEVSKGLKLADFGSCRGIYSKQPYTEYISTRWYRAPECLLTDGYYGPEMDLWGAGCVMFEITSLYALFPGTNEVDQINRIHKVLGRPSEEILQKFRSKGASHISFDFPAQKGVGIPNLISHATPDCIDIIEKMLKYDASERISAREAMRHPYFKEMRDSEARRAGANAAAAAQSSNAATVGGNVDKAASFPGPPINGLTSNINGANDLEEALPNLKQLSNNMKGSNDAVQIASNNNAAINNAAGRSQFNNQQGKVLPSISGTEAIHGKQMQPQVVTSIIL